MSGAAPVPTVVERTPAAPAGEAGAASGRPGNPPPAVGPAARRLTWRAGWPVAVSVAGYVALGVTLFWHVWSSSPATVSMVGGDPSSDMWFLRWAPFAVVHAHNPFFSTFVNAPYGVNLLTNVSFLLIGAAVSPVTLLWGPIAAFNVAATVALPASATAGYFFTRRWVAWRPAAFVGGLLYGFSPYEIGQAGAHLNLSLVVFPPLILLVTHELVVRQHGSPRRWGIVLGLLLVAQFFVSIEVLASTIVMGAVCTLAAAVMGWRRLGDRRRPHLRFLGIGAAWAAGLSAVVLAYPLWFAVRGPGSIRGAIQLVPQAYRADLAGPVVPDSLIELAPHHLASIADHFAGNASENGSYLGITLLLVLAAATVLLWRRSAAVRVAAIAGTVAFVLSLGGALVVKSAPPASVNGFPLPERLFTHLPLLTNTVPARYALYCTLFAALILGIAVDRTRGWLAGRPLAAGRDPGRAAHDRRVVAAGGGLLVAAVALVPLLPVAPFTAGIAPVGTPAYFTSPAAARIATGSITVLYPFPSSVYPDGQAWQAVGGLRFRMVGGDVLVPTGPGGTVAFTPSLGYTRDSLTGRVLTALAAGAPPPRTTGLRAAVRTELRAWRVTNLVAFPQLATDPAGAAAYLGWLMGSPGRPGPGGALTWIGFAA